MSMRYPLMWVLAAIGLLACALPWTSNAVASLNLSAYDLAEWTSLVPSVRGGSPPLLDTLLLRLPLVCLAGIIAFTHPNRIIRAIVCLVAAVALLPPLQFVTALDDINYRQQFALAVVTLIIGCVSLTRRFNRWIAFIVCVTGALTSLAGTYQGLTLQQAYGLPAHLGLGAVVYVGSCLLLAVICLIKQTR